MKCHCGFMLRLLFLFIIKCRLSHGNETQPKRPNIILFLADDFGYGDLSSYGHPSHEFNAIDQMGQEGVRFTQFYTAAVFCTPSRAAMLTGRYPFRSGMIGPSKVEVPSLPTGLPKSEVVFPRLLKENGYITGMVGKWHLGINEHEYTDGSFLPYHYGFDYVGTILPFTLEYTCDQNKRHRPFPKATKCFLYRNDTIIQQPIDLSQLTSNLLHDAKAFIYNKTGVGQPFFLYYSLPQAHDPMFNMPQFESPTGRDASYADQIKEMAWAVGEILSLLKKLGIDEDTLVLFSSDHGPHREICNRGGHPGMLKGGKGNYYEGGIRVPTIARWPGTIAPRTIERSVVSMLDLFPTLLTLAGGSHEGLPQLDGRDITDVLLGEKKEQRKCSQNDEQLKTPKRDPELEKQQKEKVLFFYCDTILMAIRLGRFKIHFRLLPLFGDEGRRQFCPDGGDPVTDFYMERLCDKSEVLETPLVFDVESDPAEEFPLGAKVWRELAGQVEIILEGHMRSVANIEESKVLLDRSYAQRHLIPCCNPPYCFCK